MFIIIVIVLIQRIQFEHAQWITIAKKDRQIIAGLFIHTYTH